MRSDSRALLIILGVLVLIVVLLPMLGVGMMGPGMMGPGMMRGSGPAGGQAGGWSWGWGLAMGLGMLTMLAFWVALIVAVVLLVRWLMTVTGSAGVRSEQSALEVLKRRYAAGEITREEYAQMRQELERSS